MKIQMSRQGYKQGSNFLGPLFVFLVVVSLPFLGLPANSGAADWPAKPITLIVPWSAGASTDLTARIMAAKMSQILRVPIQVVTKPGGSGMIGTLDVMQSQPDGYTLLVDCGGTSSIQYAWAKDLPYKVEDRTYIARIMYSPFSMIVPASSPWKTVDDLVKAIRRDPSAISFGGIGGTGVPDVCIAQFKDALMKKGVDVSKTRLITYKGTGEVMPAIAGGHVKVSFASPPSATALMDAGKLRPLAVTSPQRHKGWPSVPTMTESGFPSVDLSYWAGLGGPPDTPANIVKILDNAVKEALKDSEVISKLDKIGGVPAYQPGDQYKKFVLDEGDSIKALKLK